MPEDVVNSLAEPQTEEASVVAGADAKHTSTFSLGTNGRPPYTRPQVNATTLCSRGVSVQVKRELSDRQGSLARDRIDGCAAMPQ